jgi:hypothetical protein
MRTSIILGWILIDLRQEFSQLPGQADMPEKRKRIALAFLLLLGIVTVLIAAALPQLKFEAGVPLLLESGSESTEQVEPIRQGSISISTFIIAFIEIVVLIGLIYIGIQARKDVSWKEILLHTLGIAVVALFILMVLFGLTHVGISFEPSAPEIFPTAIAIQAPPPGPMPSGLLWLVWGGLAAGMVLLGIWFIRYRSRKNLAIDPFELAAQQAMDAMQSHLDIMDIIVRCYVQMSEALQTEQGIAFKETMTVQDFERLLKARGFPAVPVHQLSGLFENARYGHRQPGPGDEQKAFDCLNAIVQYSRANREAG